MKWLLCSMVWLLVGGCANALAGSGPAKRGGLAVSYVQPQGEFTAVADKGTALVLIFDYPMSGLAGITGTVGRYWLGEVNMTELGVGPQVDYGQMYLGVEGVYRTNDREWSLTPNAGYRRGMFDLSWRYQTMGTVKFQAVRLGVFF